MSDQLLFFNHPCTQDRRDAARSSMYFVMGQTSNVPVSHDCALLAKPTHAFIVLIDALSRLDVDVLARNHLHSAAGNSGRRPIHRTAG